MTALPATDHGPELVVLLDERHRRVGTMPKTEVHSALTPLHLAFSVYVFDTANRLLVTRRALAKHTWPGVWSNSCCGHVQPHEDAQTAARRRLREELALVPVALELALPDFAYRATSPEGIVENEVCPVFIARVDTDPVLDPSEVAQWQWADWGGFRALASHASWAISPWAALQAPLLPETPFS